MAQVQILFPTAWDRGQLEAAGALPEYAFVGPDDADCRWDFDALGLIDAKVAAGRGRVAGVFSSSDYPGVPVAAAIGGALGLPATPPAAVLRTAHKSIARALQAGIAPEATPRFQVLDPDAFDQRSFGLSFPCFVKPAKGTFSVLARRVGSMAELRAFLASEPVRDHRLQFLHIHRRLLHRYLDPAVRAGEFVAEELLHGRMCTVEGLVADGRASVLGVVDSVRDGRTGSFTAFEYPSTLPESVQRRLEDLACRLALQHGLRWTMFNVEFTWDEDRDRIGIVEVNPRICGQFADLYQKVDGVHGYQVAFALALGREPELQRGRGAHGCAASIPLRVFEPVRVVRAPAATDIAAVRAAYPGTLVWSEVRQGELLDDFHGEDGHSIRYGVINLGARDRKDLAARGEAVRRALDWRFQPLGRH